MSEDVTNTVTAEPAAQSVDTQTDAQTEGLDNSDVEPVESDNSDTNEPQKPDKFAKFRNPETGEIDHDKVLKSYEEAEIAKSKAFNERDELKKQYEQNSLNQERGNLSAYGQQLNYQRNQLLNQAQQWKDAQIAQAYQALQGGQIDDLTYTRHIQQCEQQAREYAAQVEVAYSKDMSYAQKQESEYKNKLYAQQEAEFIAKNQDFYNKPYIKPVFDEIMKEFLPENLPRVKEFAQRLISLYDRYNAGILQNQADKAKLTSNAVNLSVSGGNSKIFTRKEIDKMSDEEFSKNEKKIMEQMSKGLIK
jgi:hypothetical protein